MNKFKKSQVLVLSLLTILLIIAPLLSSSLRPTYIYFIINLHIIAHGAGAGVLSFFANPSSDHNIHKKNTKTLFGKRVRIRFRQFRLICQFESPSEKLFFLSK